MKILLLGELSSIHQELAPGLRALGHQVTVAHSRMAFDGFESDIPLYRPERETRWTQVRDITSQLLHAPRLTGFDVVQVLTPKFFNWKIHGAMMRFLKRANRKLVVVHTSCTSDYRRRVAELAYRPCKECLADDGLKSCIYDRDDERRAVQIAFEAADAIVATSYEYALSLADTPFAAKMSGIPLPVDTSRHRASSMPPMDRIRIWFGVTRSGFKGGPFILPALAQLKHGLLGDQVEVIVTERLPFADYLRFLEGVHVVIDQASGYGTGMNGLYGLAHGRAVLGGAEPETLAFLGVPPEENPVVNIKPDPDQIRLALERLVADRDALVNLGRKSAAYAARYHDSKVIARQYTALYERLLGEPEEPEHPIAAAV